MHIKYRIDDMPNEIQNQCVEDNIEAVFRLIAINQQGKYVAVSNHKLDLAGKPLQELQR